MSAGRQPLRSADPRRRRVGTIRNPPASVAVASVSNQNRQPSEPPSHCSCFTVIRITYCVDSRIPYTVLTDAVYRRSLGTAIRTPTPRGDGPVCNQSRGVRRETGSGEREGGHAPRTPNWPNACEGWQIPAFGVWAGPNRAQTGSECRQTAPDDPLAPQFVVCLGGIREGSWLGIIASTNISGPK